MEILWPKELIQLWIQLSTAGVKPRSLQLIQCKRIALVKADEERGLKISVGIIKNVVIQLEISGLFNGIGNLSARVLTNRNRPCLSRVPANVLDQIALKSQRADPRIGSERIVGVLRVIEQTKV